MAESLELQSNVNWQVDQPSKILFVDDEARILRSMKALFREHDVYSTTKPKEAAAIVKKNNIDVIVSDQRMPEMKGIDVLRQVKKMSPRTMRILLTGYSDLQAVIGSVNDGEVFRFVNKPWVNKELRHIVKAAAELSREPVVNLVSDDKPLNDAAKKVGIVVVDDDSDAQQHFRSILVPKYNVHFASNSERALQLMEQHETGVIISETRTESEDLTSMLKVLKRYHPEIASIVITARADAEMVINLINEGQVYRLLLKPVREGLCRLSIESALRHYENLKQNPNSLKRFRVRADSSNKSMFNSKLIAQIKSLPARFFAGALKIGH